MEQIVKEKNPGRDGLQVVGSEYDEMDETQLENNPHIVQVNPGDAIAFYNYDWIENNNENEKSDEVSEVVDKESPPPTGPFMNYRSLHTGMTAAKEKWIATNWFAIK